MILVFIWQKRNIDINYNRKYYVDNVYLSDTYLLNYENLFRRINIIDMMIKGSNESLLLNCSHNLSYEERGNFYHFLSMKEEQYFWMNENKKKIDFSIGDLVLFLGDYLTFCNYLTDIYLGFRNFIDETKDIISSAIRELKKKSYIELPMQENVEIYKFPNAWYITPNGYLYNTGTGHKQGNLVYPFYYIICELLRKNKDIPDFSYFNNINEILKRGYVNSFDFRDYAHLNYDLPTIITPEIEKEIKRY